LRLLVLEDSPYRLRWFLATLNEQGSSVTLCHRADHAIETLRTEAPFDYVFLDHDLVERGPDCGTGRDVAAAIIADGLATPDHTLFVVHSVNSVSARKIEAELAAAGYVVRRCSFPLLVERVRGFADVEALFREVPA
jgi:CheY-like chemotaxis protein